MVSKCCHAWELRSQYQFSPGENTHRAQKENNSSFCQLLPEKMGPLEFYLLLCKIYLPSASQLVHQIKLYIIYLIHILDLENCGITQQSLISGLAQEECFHGEHSTASEGFVTLCVCTHVCVCVCMWAHVFLETRRKCQRHLLKTALFYLNFQQLNFMLQHHSF